LDLLFLFLSTASNHAGNGRRRAPRNWRAAHGREPRCAMTERSDQSVPFFLCFSYIPFFDSLPLF
jgi:hypothetical protein